MLFTGVLCIFLFIAGLPMVTNGGIYILTLFDDFAGTYGEYIVILAKFKLASALLVVSITEMLVVTWVYGIENFCLDIKLMIGKDVSAYWRICWKFISPALLSVSPMSL